MDGSANVGLELLPDNEHPMICTHSLFPQPSLCLSCNQHPSICKAAISIIAVHYMLNVKYIFNHHSSIEDLIVTKFVETTSRLNINFRELLGSVNKRISLQ